MSSDFLTAPRELGVALLGLGNVGAGVVTLLAENAPAIEARLGARLVVRTIAVRELTGKTRRVDVDAALLTTDVEAAVKRDDVQIVCELMGGVDLARAAVLGAIAAGKHVVTANKALLAEHGAEVFAAAERAGVDVYYEAAVCGGVPVIRVLREGLASDRVEHFVGIVNGTSNFILSAMTSSRRPFGDVLAEAQALGYAEADPTLDVSGGDAAHKLTLLAMLCFGTLLDVHSITTQGIDAVDELDLTIAHKFGYAIKPIVLGRDHGHAIEARVHPALIPLHWLLADVPGAKNALYVHSYALGASLYYGAGAGMLPTAMSVVSDMIEVARNISAHQAGVRPTRRASSATTAPRPLLPAADSHSRFYLRVGVDDKPGVMGRITTILGAHNVSLAQVIQHESEGAEVPTRIFVVTHVAREGNIVAALAEIDRDVAVREPARLLRIAGQ